MCIDASKLGKRATSLPIFMRELMVAALLLWGVTHIAAAQEPGDVRDQTEQVLQADDIQRDAPLAERTRKQANQVAQDPTLQHEPPAPIEAPPPKPLSMPIPGDLFLYLLLATLAVCIALAAYHLYRTYAPGRRGASVNSAALEVEARAIGAPAEDRAPELDEIENLARAGAYADAIHLMLLRALEALRRRLGASWPKSLTSREIARRGELAATDRQALKVLVGAVEICRFGGQNANEQIYHTCLDHYRQIGVEQGAAAA